MSGEQDIRIAELQQQLAEAEKEIKSLKLAVRAENLKVRIASEYTNFGLWEYDIADDISYQYKKLNGIYETNLDPIVHFRDTILGWGIVYSDDIPVFHKMCDAMQRGDKEILYDVRVINDYCDIVWFRYEGKTIYDDNGKPIRIVGRTLDVTEEKGGIGASSDDRRDLLTGAFTKESFAEIVQQRVQEKSFKNSALMILGIDGYADMCEAGKCDTEYLQRSLVKVLESQSTVEQGSLLCRVDDGVFAFYVKFSDLPNLNAIASRLIFKFYDQRFVDNDGEHITISAGVSVFKNVKSYDAAYKEALTALEAAVAKGGNGFLMYSASMAAERRVSYSDFNEALNTSGAAGAEDIYQLINTALVNEDASHDAIARALREAGRYSSAGYVYFCRFGTDGGADDIFMLWSRDGNVEYDPKLPAFRPMYGSERTSQLLSGKDMIFATAERRNSAEYGFEFANGAVTAVLCPVYAGKKVAGYFTFVNDSMTVWQAADSTVIKMLSDTLNAMFTGYYKKMAYDAKMNFTDAVIGNLGLEGFTLLPDSYEVDYVGENAANNYGLKKGDICYKRIRGFDEPCADCPIHQLKAGQLTASCAYYREQDSRWINISASSVEMPGGERYAISTTDITNCISNVQTRDTLTGVMGFDRFAVDAMRTVAQAPEGCYITVVNIANFRRLNEHNGYEFGNSVLIAVADVLASSIKDGELLCRSEGARFVALHRSVSIADYHNRLKQMLVSAQRQVSEKCGIQIYLVAGVYEFGVEHLGIMASLDRAIIAQKTVKDRAYYTENMIAVYDSELSNEIQARQYVEAHMVEALENNEFKVFYQPKVNTETGEIEGAEALARWIRPDGEMISPARFVPVFEQNGFIADMDFAIYRNAVADIRRWMRDGIDVPQISLNVSRHHMRDESFPDKICALVDNLGVPREKIELEITESMLTENMNKLIDAMKTLKDAGFRISVDDFGSGYSSLNLITVLPFHTLKIDGGFFLRNELTEKNKKVITSIVELAKSLNYQTVSEGVETDEQVEFLREIGCDMIQGYYYYKPMPVKDFEELVKGNKA